MDLNKEQNANYDQMLIVDKYETVISYLYPIAQNLPRKHGVAKEIFIQALLNQVQLFMDAGKSNSVSKLYLADAGLAHLRFWLRFLNGKEVRGITIHQVETAQMMISEVGKILGAWIGKQKRRGQHG
jgi:hypothetical protein